MAPELKVGFTLRSNPYIILYHYLVCVVERSFNLKKGVKEHLRKRKAIWTEVQEQQMGTVIGEQTKQLGKRHGPWSFLK